MITTHLLLIDCKNASSLHIETALLNMQLNIYYVYKTHNRTYFSPCTTGNTISTSKKSLKMLITYTHNLSACYTSALLLIQWLCKLIN